MLFLVKEIKYNLYNSYRYRDDIYFLFNIGKVYLY